MQSDAKADAELVETDTGWIKRLFELVVLVSVCHKSDDIAYKFWNALQIFFDSAGGMILQKCISD